MSDINQTYGVAGAGYQFTIGDATYTLMPLTQGMKAAYASWVQKRGRDSAADTELYYRERIEGFRNQLRGDSLTDEERQDIGQKIMQAQVSANRQMSEFNEKRTAGAYEFHGEVVQSSLSQTEGTTYLVYLMLRPKHSRITLDEVRDLVTNHGWLIEDAVREVQQVKKEPSSKTPTVKEDQPLVEATTNA